LFFKIDFLSVDPLRGEDFYGSGTWSIGLKVSISGVTDLFIGLLVGLFSREGLLGEDTL